MYDEGRGDLAMCTAVNVIQFVQIVQTIFAFSLPAKCFACRNNSLLKSS